MSVDSLIRVNDVSYIYGSEKVLENVSFDVNKADYVAIIGPNGSGKTTLLKILLGLLKPSSGFVNMTNQLIGYVPQRVAQDTLSFPASVYEIVESGRVTKTKLFGQFSKDDKLAINSALEIARISNLKDSQIGSLSGGQKQRVYIARALASQPQILILDEPLTGVDIAAQKEFYDFLRELNEQQGITIIFVSHDIDVVTEKAKSVLCLNKTVISFGPATELEEEKVIESMYGKRITHLHHV